MRSEINSSKQSQHETVIKDIVPSIEEQVTRSNTTEQVIDNRRKKGKAIHSFVLEDQESVNTKQEVVNKSASETQETTCTTTYTTTYTTTFTEQLNVEENVGSESNTSTTVVSTPQKWKEEHAFDTIEIDLVQFLKLFYKRYNPDKLLAVGDIDTFEHSEDDIAELMYHLCINYNVSESEMQTIINQAKMVEKGFLRVFFF